MMHVQLSCVNFAVKVQAYKVNDSEFVSSDIQMQHLFSIDTTNIKHVDL